MKREICAALLLAALLAVSFWSVRKADSLTEEIKEHLALSEKALLAGDPEYAEQQFQAAMHIWLSARSYTQIFLPHPELDGTTDVFFETLQALRKGETQALPAAYNRLRCHLDSIAEMEHISAGSVF